jgi:hypothetical protein
MFGGHPSVTIVIVVVAIALRIAYHVIRSRRTPDK